MKATIKRFSITARHRRWHRLAWFLLLWGIGVLSISGFAYLLRALLDPVLGV